MYVVQWLARPGWWNVPTAASSPASASAIDAVPGNRPTGREQAVSYCGQGLACLLCPLVPARFPRPPALATL